MVNIASNEMVVPSGEVKSSPQGERLGACLLVIDVQERLAPAVPAAPQVIARIAQLIDRAREILLPILASEQYSRGLGPTVPALRQRLADTEVIEKIHFAAPREAAFAKALAAGGIRRAVVVGMEAHVCVQQTVLALLDRGVAVTVAGDAVASRREIDCRAALARLARAGATISDSTHLLARWSAAPAAPSRSAG